MKKTLYGVIALPLLMGIGMAQQSWAAQLSDAQMDKVTAGFDFSQADQVPPVRFNKVLWAGLMSGKPYPAIKGQAAIMNDD